VICIYFNSFILLSLPLLLSIPPFEGQSNIRIIIYKQNSLRNWLTHLCVNGAIHGSSYLFKKSGSHSNGHFTNTILFTTDLHSDIIDNFVYTFNQLFIANRLSNEIVGR
jgi:hypothetical protein